MGKAKRYANKLHSYENLIKGHFEFYMYVTDGILQGFLYVTSLWNSL